MHCILLVLLHGANGHPQELDINQVRIAAASWYRSAVYQICKQYFLVYCNLGQFLYAFHGMRHVPIGITLSFYCVCARITWRSVLIVCPPRLSVRGLQLHNLFTSNAIRMQPYQLTNRKYHTVEKSSMIVGL